ncbi:PIG-L family deacetylase [Haloarcula hispanica]|uniref:PIG-L family deacetylase n=1 Tax=Haloarcula hispanica TaxID=51589 RepID=A0A5J5LLN7_HALHI|nr:PIG-L deacetylase family protein [Haloarcula hispanica]KAA9410364.1 PIG-L family deacetylase [Haloarcula hispanica]
MNVLCVVAHPDDEILGVGGTLARHANAGDDVHIAILSNGVMSRYDSDEAAQSEIDERSMRAREACEIIGGSVEVCDFPDNSFDTVPLLDIVQTIEGEIKEHNPEIVYTHHHGDLNVDHELACRATITATRPLSDSCVDRVLAFETLSATEWAVPKSSNAFQPTTFVDISEYHNTKMDALRVYERELREPPHPRNPVTVKKNAQVWGAKSGFDAAEPFQLLRETR